MESPNIKKEENEIFSIQNQAIEDTDDENSNIDTDESVGVDYEEKKGERYSLDNTSDKDDDEGEEDNDDGEEDDDSDEGLEDAEDNDEEADEHGEEREDDDEEDDEKDEDDVEEGKMQEDTDNPDESENESKINKQSLKINDLPMDEDEEFSDSDDESEDEEDYFKIDRELEKETLLNSHPGSKQISYDEILALCKIVRDNRGLIVDELHKTVPFVTKYEYTKVIGLRTKQLNNGADPFITVGPDIIDGYTIALKEFEEKKLPFIICRPMPNGTKEYWKLSDLEIVHF